MSKLTSVLKQIAAEPGPTASAVEPLSECERQIAESSLARLNLIEEAIEEVISNGSDAAYDVDETIGDELSFVETEPVPQQSSTTPSGSADAADELVDDVSADASQTADVSQNELELGVDLHDPEPIPSGDRDVETDAASAHGNGAAPPSDVDVGPQKGVLHSSPTQDRPGGDQLEDGPPLHSPTRSSGDGLLNANTRETGIAALRDHLVADLAPWETGRLLMFVSVDRESDRTPMIADLARQLVGDAERSVLALDATDRTATDEAESDDCSGERTSGSLDSILQGGIVDDAAVRPTSTEGLFVLPRGGDPSLARKLNDELVNRATAALRSNYDFVLVDGGDWGNALVPRLANHMDAVYLCVQSQWTTETGAQRAVSQLRRSGVRLAGCVLSGAAVVAEKSS